MKQKKCPLKRGGCWDYGDCEGCEWNKLIGKYERKIARLEKAVRDSINAFTRMETLYKVKCTEIESRKGIAFNSPCKAGTPVWFIYDCGGRGGEKIAMSEGVVRSVTFDETTVWLYGVYNDGLTYHHTADEIGDRLFFNQEQAKQKLKELKEKV